MTSLFTLWDYMNIVFANIAGIFNFQLLLYMLFVKGMLNTRFMELKWRINEFV